MHHFGQLGHALGELVDVLASWDTQTGYGAGNAIFEHLLQTAPGTGRLVGYRSNLLVRALTGFGLQRFTFLHQRFKNLAALFLRLGIGAQAGQPDLLGGLFDGGGELVVGH